MSTILLNYTPHTIHLHAGPGVQTIPSSGEARAAEIALSSVALPTDPFGDGGMVVDVPLALKCYGDVTGLPLPRADLVIRDSAGRVTGCKGLYRLVR